MPPINRRFYGQRLPDQADVPEASQQQESMLPTGSPLPDENGRLRTGINISQTANNNTVFHESPFEANTQISTDPGVGTVISAKRTEPKTQRVIGQEQIKEAQEVLLKYKQGKTHLENRIIDDELWWELRHWESIGRGKSDEEKKSAANRPKPTSAWLFNSIVNKHADAMDNYPEPLVLPRERGDEQSAKVLSSVLPVIMEQNDFEDCYRLNWWEKLKHGTAIYGIFWDSTKENGLGDVSIKQIDILKLFWEPGITNIQDSRNLFICELVDTDLLDEQYPDHKGKMKAGGNIEIPKYLYTDDVDLTDKSLVVDWYYRVHDASGKTVLHYCKWCNDEVLYASENDPQYRDRGFYDHGLYPVVLDVLYPEKGTPVGFGYVAVCKDPQLYIDELSSNLLKTSMMGSRRRYFVSSSTNVNTEDFADWNKELVRVEGEISDSRIMPVSIEPPAPIYANILQMKIEEMKDTSSNRDVNSGGTGAGVTAAAGIAALQEAGNKVVRSQLRATYKSCSDIYKMVIELIRQFYDTTRAFRVTGANESDYQFLEMNNAGLVDQPVGMSMDTGETLYRKPVFDLKVQAQKRNPFSTMEANQRASELYGMGFFNPDRATEAIAALEMMEFEGIDKVRDSVRQGNTLQNIIIQQNQIIQQMAGMLGIQTGAGPAMPPGGGSPAPHPSGPPSGISANSTAGTPRTSYMNRLAARSSPNMNDAQAEAANPVQR